MMFACSALSRADESDVAGKREDQPVATNGVAATARWAARLRVSYDYREQGSAHDSDLYGYFYGRGDDLASETLDIYLSARLHSDLDKPDSTSLADDPFRSVDDSNGVTENRVMQLYGDWHTRDRRIALRAGRQYVDVADYLQLDGAQLILREEERWGGRIYGGAPVSYYKSISGDYAGGVSLLGRPFDTTRVRLTLSRYYDDRQDDSDQNYYLDIQQKLSDEARLRAQASLLNEDFRMARADYAYFSDDGETDFTLGGSYWGSFDAKTRAYSPLYNVLGKQNPYTYAYTRLTQQVAPQWYVSPGVSLRFADGGENAYNNRDYENYDFTVTYQPTRAISASVAAEYWSVEGGDSFMGWSGELRYRKGRVWELSGGASYAEYTYDTYSDLSYSINGGQVSISDSGTVIEESPYVRTYFVRAKWKVSRMLALRAQGDIEDNEVADDVAYRGRVSIEVRY